MEELKTHKKEKISVRTIGLLGMMKYLIDDYIESLVDPNYDALLSEGDCLTIESIINQKKESVEASLTVYAIRSLCDKKGSLDAAAESDLSQNWLNDLKEAQNKKKKQIGSGIKDISDPKQTKSNESFSGKFDVILQNIKNAKDYESSILNLIKELDKTEDKSLCLLGLVYNNIYWKNMLNEEQKSCELLTEKLQKQLGAVRVQIIKKLTSNFEKTYGLLHLSPSLSAGKIRIASIICHTSIGVISKLLKGGKTCNVYDFLLENNSFEGLAIRIANSFIPGAEPEENIFINGGCILPLRLFGRYVRKSSQSLQWEFLDSQNHLFLWIEIISSQVEVNVVRCRSSLTKFSRIKVELSSIT